MDLVSLTKFIAKSLIKNKDQLQVNFEESGTAKIIQILVDKSDIGSIIGKRGMIANAIRTLVQAASYSNELGQVKINIDELPKSYENTNE